MENLKSADHSYLLLVVKARFDWLEADERIKNTIVLVANSAIDAVSSLKDFLDDQGFTPSQRNTDSKTTLAMNHKNRKVDIDVLSANTMFILGTQVDQIKALFSDFYYVEALEHSANDRRIQMIEKSGFYSSILEMLNNV